jgi:hypothetical protein
MRWLLFERSNGGNTVRHEPASPLTFGQLFTMELLRGIGNPPVITSEGVHFVLESRERLVRFVVTCAGLSNLAGHALSIAELEDTFYRHRKMIEAIASHKHNAIGAPCIRTTVDPEDIAAFALAKAV